MLGAFIFKLTQLAKLTKSQKSVLHNKYKVVSLQGSNTAFSFFNYVFIGTKVSGTETIIRHELVHIDQKYSLDIIFLELIKIISWFNPFIYLLQRSLKTLHEYIADEQTAAFENDALTYSSFLVSNAYGISGSSITHSFFNYNLIKKRIIMLNQKRSGNLARLKYLLAVPLCAGLLCVSTLGVSKSYGWVDIAPKHELVSSHNARIANLAANYDSTKLTSKGFKYRENGYLIKGKTNYRVITIEKNGEEKEYFRNSATTADVKLLRDKYGYKFPTMTLYTRLPPPPPTAPGKPKSVDKRLPPPAPQEPKPKITNVKLMPPPPVPKEAKPKITNVTLRPPPPMAPFMPPSKEFYEMSRYIARYVRYPAVAFENKLVGSVIVKFDIAENHKLSNVIFIKGIGSGCDEEVLRVIKGYSGDINTKSGTYKLAVTFNLDGIEAPKPASETLANDPSFAGEVLVEGYPSK